MKKLENKFENFNTGYSIEEQLKFALRKYTSYISYDDKDKDLALIIDDEDIDTINNILDITQELNMILDVPKTILKGGKRDRYYFLNKSN